MSTPYAANVPSRALPKGMAVASLVLGILGILTSFFLLGGLLGLVALILGFVALGKIKKGEADGRGMAIGGIITGAIALLLTVLIVATVGAFFADKKDELSNLSDCLNNAQGNAQAERACQDEFSRQINP